MNIAFITLTNTGYLPYTLNCLTSLKRIGITELKCYAIGQDCHRQLLHKKYDASLIQEATQTSFQTYRSGHWADVVLHKFAIIHENLKQYEVVCYTDGDIVFKNASFLKYCQAKLADHDLLIQNDTLEDQGTNNLCSGFMFIRSNAQTLK